MPHNGLSNWSICLNWRKSSNEHLLVDYHSPRGVHHHSSLFGACDPYMNTILALIFIIPAIFAIIACWSDLS